MINLIKNELSKIFHKKIIYILLLISLVFIVLTNVIYKSTNDFDKTDYDKAWINDLREEQKTIDLKNANNIDWYVGNQTMIDIYDLKIHYGLNSWQSYIIDNGFYEIIQMINYNTYSKVSDKTILKEYQKKYDNLISKLDTNDWKYFVSEDIKEAEKETIELIKNLKSAKGKTEINSLNEQIYQNDLKIETLNIRLTKDISYGYDYLNTALSEYTSSKSQIYTYQNKELKPNEQIEYNSLVSNLETNKYILDTGKNIDDNSNMRGIYQGFYSEYLFLIAAVIIVISGVIVSEEYNKGTIKLLLVRPYSRIKILLSKYLTCLIMIAFTIVSLFLLQTIVGWITFGTSSLAVPVVNYNFNTNALSIMNIFKYFGIITLVTLPKIILLMTLSFSLGTLFGHSAIAIAVTLIGFFGADVLNYMIIAKDVEFLKYWVTLNWDFDAYLFGGLPNFQYINLTFSIVICLIYYAIMMITSFSIFKHKNIKNI